MSADLFAEFNTFSSKPQSQQSQQTGQPHPVTQQQQKADPFDFFTSSNASAQVNQPVQAWPQSQNQSQRQSQTDSFGGWGDFSSLSASQVSQQQPRPPVPATAAEGDDDDGWGDFEVAEAPPEPSRTLALEPPIAAPLPPANISAPPTRTRVHRASTLDLMTNSLVPVEGQSDPRQPSPSLLKSAVVQASKPKQPKPKDPNVLFDAEDSDVEVDDDDDFGEFEVGETMFAQSSQQPSKPWQHQPKSPPWHNHPKSPPWHNQPKSPPWHNAPQPREQQSQVASLASLDLLSLEDPPATQPKRHVSHLSSLSVASSTSTYPQAPKSPSFSDRNPFPGLALKTPTSPNFPKEPANNPESPTPVTAWPALRPNISKEGEPPESWDWDAVDGVETSSSKPAVKPMANTARKVQNANTSGSDATPPTNIPPPSVLLSIFPELLALANTSLFKPAASQPTSIKDRIASDPGTIAFLQGYLALPGSLHGLSQVANCAGIVTSFLPKEWPFSSAGAKGMRLAGVDRAQTAREDREAADVVDVWKEHVGRLRSAVAAAKSAPGGQQLRVPDLAENMAVTTAKVVPTAPKACLVCGLKRDERVGKVDFDVEDSFGEWWVDHWGHRACKNFWTEHEKQLRQR
ncbi:uncharacterized protein VDAG_06493 [Verticillium dahliae VdLs.17]|uniref:Serine/threonine-protein kinase ppk6 n=1 Tax=Verticillium dahliae (strain VdLs.17 / ATCC MYA-4575 / FGSC 10137) TaxID=498257 RepID=G2X7N5_VERDV|nr:uncharacterized protein VDAG_06493 [Verticillium dahliae VdLs.17]EGY15003.1 hypothetical protein VDAG_06493 [Verticillium dahliae VdLs.17]